MWNPHAEVPADRFLESGGDPVSEASDLGWPPGLVPPSLTMTERAPGNGMPFLLDRRRSDDARFVYAQNLGCTTAIVFND